MTNPSSRDHPQTGGAYANREGSYVADFKPSKGGLNSALNKDVKASVSAVSPKVIAVKESFKAVCIFLEQSPSHSTDAILLRNWRLIEKDYTTLLQDSGTFATQGKNVYYDFFESLLPGLLSSNNIEGMCDELSTHRKIFEEGKDQVENFLATLKLVAKRVGDFKVEWDEIKKSSGGRAESKQRAVVEHSNEIISNTDKLQAMWNLICDDLHLIDVHLRATSSANDQVLFRQKLTKLPAQYDTLKDAMEKYSAALSSDKLDADTCNIFRKWFRLLSG